MEFSHSIFDIFNGLSLQFSIAKKKAVAACFLFFVFTIPELDLWKAQESQYNSFFSGVKSADNIHDATSIPTLRQSPFNPKWLRISAWICQIFSGQAMDVNQQFFARPDSRQSLESSNLVDLCGQLVSS